MSRTLSVYPSTHPSIHPSICLSIKPHLADAQLIEREGAGHGQAEARHRPRLGHQLAHPLFEGGRVGACSPRSAARSDGAGARGVQGSYEAAQAGTLPPRPVAAKGSRVPHASYTWPVIGPCRPESAGGGAHGLKPVSVQWCSRERESIRRPALAPSPCAIAWNYGWRVASQPARGCHLRLNEYKYN